MSNQLKEICNQLIEENDLQISKPQQEMLKTSNLAIEIIEDPSIIKIYTKKRLTLSDIIPLLHDFGFIVDNEVSFSLLFDEEIVYITKLYLKLEKPSLLAKHAQNISEILHQVLSNETKERCSLFSLAYTQNFCIHTILLLRTLGHYENQLILEFNISKILQTLAKYNILTDKFFTYFSHKFDPSLQSNNKDLEKIEDEITTLFKEIKQSDDDRILKLFFKILQNILRTNYYLYKDSIAIKVDVQNLKPYLKGIQPQLETYVYHRNFRGTHLRMSKVARGGIRYSNRKDDYRNEIKSLMATQEGKNAIIIPSGAKGGFIIDVPKSQLTFDDFSYYYKSFIDALLDMIDNKQEQTIIKNNKIISYDSADTYFVVAADRGTSNMSDTANQLAKQREFWIDDAFASGGSNGFHHKKLGITAKGALKSVQRFFIEKGIDFYKDSITVVGIGSMGGDVFGNGMIESDKFLLIGAISHDEIFIDPNPDPLASFEERKRLFNNKKHKWSDYDKSKISKDGGVFKRSQKEIKLNKTLQKLLNLTQEKIDGESLARAILKLPVDMLYNGGVGTYIKSSQESNLDIGDKENEYVRVDASDIKAYSICEGGNLGLTQKARYEYALQGGLIHLDSIDNAAGVNTSDHEVNLKIILNTLIHQNYITSEQKHNTLKSLTPYAIKSVLWTNYLQSLGIALDHQRSRNDKNSFVQVINVLENNLEVFKRRYFNLPKDINFNEIVDKKGFIIRPVISVLFLYSKIFLKNILDSSKLYGDDIFFQKYLFKYFPKEFVTLYEDAIIDHPLKKQIISMIIANKIINQYGATFINDYESLGKDNFLHKIKSYLIINQLYDANDIRFEIYRQDYTVTSATQYTLLLKIEDKIDYNVKWMLRHMKSQEFGFESILDYKNAIASLTQQINLPSKKILANNKIINDFFNKIHYLKFAPAIIKIKQQTSAPFEKCALIAFHIVETFEITSLIEYIESITPKQTNELLLQNQLQILLEQFIMELTTDLLAYQRSGENLEDTFNHYLKDQNFDTKRYKTMLNNLKKQEHRTISDLSVIVNYFLLLKG